MTKYEFFFGSLVLFAIVVCVAIAAYFTFRSNEYSLEQTRITQEQETIRNEEDNQFWQKVIPWGEYEQEKEE